MNHTINIRPDSVEMDGKRLLRFIYKESHESGKNLVVKISDQKEKRKEAQSRLQFHWYKELEMQSNDTAEYFRGLCKLTYGVPIAREDDEFRELYDSTIKGLPFEQKVALMMEPMDIPITRNFTVREMARYLSAIEVDMVKQGYRLSSNDDLYFMALMKDAA